MNFFLNFGAFFVFFALFLRLFYTFIFFRHCETCESKSWQSIELNLSFLLWIATLAFGSLAMTRPKANALRVGANEVVFCESKKCVASAESTKQNPQEFKFAFEFMDCRACLSLYARNDDKFFQIYPLPNSFLCSVQSPATPRYFEFPFFFFFDKFC